MSDYRAIPGIGNFSVLYTYNSSWHMLMAFFSFSWLGFQCFNDLNGYLYLLMILAGLEVIHQSLHHNRQLISTLVLLFFFFTYFFLRAFICLSSADFALGIITFGILVILLAHILYKAGRGFEHAYLMVMVASFAYTIKISGCLLLIIPIYMIVGQIRQGAYKNVRLSLCMITLILSPLLIRNAITSGYVFAPLNMIDILSFDWKMPAATEKSGLVGWSYLLEPYRTGITHISITEVDLQGKKITEPVPLTFKGILRAATYKQNVYDIGLSMVLLLSTFIHLVAGITYLKRIKSWFSDSFLFAMVLYGGMLIWLLILPVWIIGGLRIAIGYVGMYVCLAMALVIWHLDRLYKPFATYLLLTASFLFQIKNIFNVEDKQEIVSNYWLVPPAYPITHTKPVKIDDTYLYMPVGNEVDFCWGSPQPCTYTKAKNLESRGKTIEDGFRIKNP
ncbi:MAG: hypothetical protein H7Y04_10790 [Verrucomicrobia bacterium]|nr:hypothetical protein [Cytophagales bacterium]